jgi:hypothetical protein
MPPHCHSYDGPYMDFDKIDAQVLCIDLFVYFLDRPATLLRQMRIVLNVFLPIRQLQYQQQLKSTK